MRSVVETLIEAAKAHERGRGRFSLEEVSRKADISVRTLKRLFSGRMRNDRIPYMMVVRILTALRCSVTEFEQIRGEKKQLTLLAAYFKRWRNAREDRFLARLQTATKYCTELKAKVTLGQCHDCWHETHDGAWRQKYRTRGRCRQRHIGRREKDDG